MTSRFIPLLRDTRSTLLELTCDDHTASNDRFETDRTIARV